MQNCRYATSKTCRPTLDLLMVKLGFFLMLIQRVSSFSLSTTSLCGTKTKNGTDESKKKNETIVITQIHDEIEETYLADFKWRCKPYAGCRAMRNWRFYIPRRSGNFHNNYYTTYLENIAKRGVFYFNPRNSRLDP